MAAFFVLPYLFPLRLWESCQESRWPLHQPCSIFLHFVSSGQKDGLLQPVNGWHANSCHWSFVLEAPISSWAWIPRQSRLTDLSFFHNKPCLAQNKLLLPAKRHRMAKLYRQELQNKTSLKVQSLRPEAMDAFQSNFSRRKCHRLSLRIISIRLYIRMTHYWPQKITAPAHQSRVQ